jgi:nucleotide-binding universal stress UspA family protein
MAATTAIHFDKNTNLPNVPLQVPGTNDTANETNGTVTPNEVSNGTGRTSRRNSMDAHLRRKVLIAYDNSEFSERMFEWAINEILKPENDHVVLATVLDVQESTFIHTHFQRNQSVGRQGHARRLSISEQDEATSKLRPLVDRLVSKGITAQINVLKGDAKTKLVELSKETKADLFIIGSRGLGTVKRLTMGSVSDYCVHNAECPVLVVHQKALNITLTRTQSRRSLQ